MSIQRWCTACIAVIAIASGFSTVRAQSVGGTVSGVINDAIGAPVAGAELSLVHAETAVARHTTSDADGRYRLTSLTPGIWHLDVRVPGFAPHADELRVAAGQTLLVAIQLQIAGGREEIQVAASPLQRESAELGAVIAREQVLGLPVNGRSYEQLALLEPGVVSTTSRETGVLYQHGLKININGAGSRSNAFLLDGTNVADLYNNGLGSVAGTFLGLEAVREFQVLTNAYQASYGGVSGGVVSIVTKSGSSQMQGSIFGTFRDGRLDAKGYFDDRKPKFWRRQGGFSLGGPLRRERAVFFVTGELLRESLGQTQIATVPSLAARNGELSDPASPGGVIAVNPVVRPYLDLFPLPNGVDFGDGLAEYRFATTRPTRETFGQGRVDVDLGPRNSLFARITVSDARKQEPGNFPDSQVDWDSTSRFVTLEDTHVLSDRIVNTTRASYSVTDLSQRDTTGQGLPDDLSLVPGRGMPHLVIGGMPAFGSLVSPYTRGRQRLFAIAEDLTISAGPHLLKMGALVERVHALIDFQIFWAGRYSFPSVRQFLQGRPSVLSLALPGSDSLRELSTLQFGSYVQDDVQVAPGVMVSAGVRWEMATAPREADGRLVTVPDPLHDTAPTVGTLLRTRRGNVAPRVGLVWTPSAAGHTVIRGGAGLFYDINTLPFVAQTVSNNPPFYQQVTVPNAAFPRPVLSPSTALSVGVPQYDWQTPRVLQFNAALERELPGRTTVTVAYAGSRGTHVVRSGDLNAPIPQIQADGTPLFPVRGARRNPAFGAITIRTTDGHSWYDALQVKVARRLHAGLQFQAGYTLSRSLDETQGTVPTESNGSVTQWMDPDRPATDRGPADFDRRHNLTAHAIWQTPRLARAAPLLRRVFGEWTISGIVAVRSGNPFTPGIQDDYARTLVRVSVHRPDYAPGVDPEQIVLGDPARWFDPSSFTLQAPGTFGNVGRNSLRGPGLATVDAALAKAIRPPWSAGGNAARGASLQLRLDLFNLLNRANFGLPQRIVFAGAAPQEAPLGSAGRITSTTTGPRELQASVRLTW